MADEEILPTLHANRDGETQLRRHWPVSNPKASVLGVHGISEHTGRYSNVGDALRQANFDLIMFDHRGHGQSAGSRGFVDSYERFFDDIEDLLEERRQLNVPVVLLGHSLGGLIVGSYLLTNRPKPDLVVLSSPAFRSSHSRFDRLLASFMNRVAPKVFVPRKSDPAILSSDIEVQRTWDTDLLVLRGATGGLADSSFKAMDAFEANRRRLTVPTYVLHGSEDKLVPPEVTSALLEGMENVTYRLWTGMRHECFNEVGFEAVLDEMIVWLNSQIADFKA